MYTGKIAFAVAQSLCYYMGNSKMFIKNNNLHNLVLTRNYTSMKHR